MLASINIDLLALLTLVLWFGGMSIFFALVAKEMILDPENFIGRPKKAVLKWLALFLITALGGLFSIHGVEHLARKELRNNLLIDQTKIEVEHKYLSPKEIDKLKLELTKIEHIDGHHSSPRSSIKISMTNGNVRSKIKVCRDSKKKNEYWIFWNKYRYSKTNEIGRIISDSEIFNILIE